jgi:hypothetical protein
MFLKSMFIAVLGALLLAAGTALAAGYRPDDFLTLDLSQAVLSPTPIGPTNHFIPVPVKAGGDASGEMRNSHVSRARMRPERVATIREAPSVAAPERHRGAARTKLAHRHGNPLDARAQAMDRRIQTWPCRSGGICSWKQVPIANE